MHMDAYRALFTADCQLILVATLQASGAAQLAAAKKLKPGAALQFAIFVREQQSRQAALGNSSGEAAVDLV